MRAIVLRGRDRQKDVMDIWEARKRRAHGAARG